MTEEKIFLLNNDIIFKNVFNTKERLKRLLEAILKVKINDIESKNTELERNNKKTKKFILDLVVDTDIGKINVEINNNSDNYIIKRNLLYFFRLIESCLKTSDNYENIKKHIQINLTWNLQKHYDYDISKRDMIDIYLMDEKEGKRRCEDLFKIVDVNMDYYGRLCYNKNMTEEEKLLKFLSSKDEKELRENSGGDKFMEKLEKEVRILNNDPELMEALIVEGEEERVRNTERLLGKREGIEEGKEEGIKKEKITIAKNMIKKQMDINTISEITGLSLDELENLK